MAIDLQFIQSPDGEWDIDFENGDFKMTDGLDTALYLSIFGEARASRSQIRDSRLRRGHFTNIFSNIEGYEIGNTSWINIDQGKNTTNNLNQIIDQWNNGIKWMIDDNIISKAEIKADNLGSSIIAEINITSKSQQDSNYYNLFINTFN